MWYVYIIRSENFPEQEYVGATADLKRRLPEHNAGKSAHTAKFRPWKLVWYCAFPDKYSTRIRKISKISLRPRLRQEALLTKPTLPPPH
jgi:predicted GIY-YIG superfamily endonuclease